MLASRIILNPRNLLSRNVLPFRDAGKIVRENHVVISVPPRVKISTGTKIIHIGILGLSMFLVPAWVLYYIPDYQKEDRNVYTGK